MSDVNVNFIDSKTAAKIPGLPSVFDEKQLVIGEKSYHAFFPRRLAKL